tara:strand:- start:61 stop:615 length:555 start_codon:yes stop_codon:yes gene_type:complete
MKKKDEEAFLRSIVGTIPIKKNNDKPRSAQKLKKKKINYKTKFKESVLAPKANLPKRQKLENVYNIEKSPINKKLKKGRIPIDRKIDFHGLSVLDAEDVFTKTIISCYGKNLRCLLFVTGKGTFKKNNEEEKQRLYYGKIRNNFFSWINKKEIQKYILSFEQASIEHGGDGAFFIYLRKNKTNF